MAVAKQEEKYEFQSIHRSFEESVAEVRKLVLQKKELIPHPPTEELGNPVETFTADYNETVAEIHRIELIKTLGSRFK